MCSRTDQDSQELTRISSHHKAILDLKAKRQRAGHASYGLIALTLTVAAAFVWGLVFRDAHTGATTHIDRPYLAFLAFAQIVGIASTASTLTWMVVRAMQRQIADHDTIRTYDDEQLVKHVADAVYARIVKAQKAEQQTLWETRADKMEKVFSSANGPVARQRSEPPPSADPSPVIRLPQGRRPNRYN